MKKLGKLEINSEKLMKNEELMTLRGGYGAGDWCGQCIVSCPGPPATIFSGPCCDINQYMAETMCQGYWARWGSGCICNAF